MVESEIHVHVGESYKQSMYENEKCLATHPWQLALLHTPTAMET